MHSLRLQHELDELGWAIKMRWPTICIKNRTNIYSYAFTYIHAALKVPVREKRKKRCRNTLTFLAFTFYWHTEKENAQIWYSNFSVFHFFWIFVLFIDTGIDFCIFRELSLSHIVFVWIRFIKKITTIYQYENSKEKNANNWKIFGKFQQFGEFNFFADAKRMENNFQ